MRDLTLWIVLLGVFVAMLLGSDCKREPVQPSDPSRRACAVGVLIIEPETRTGYPGAAWGGGE